MKIQIPQHYICDLCKDFYKDRAYTTSHFYCCSRACFELWIYSFNFMKEYKYYRTFDY